MRGSDHRQASCFSYVSPEERVPKDHPLRPIRRMLDELLSEMSREFSKLYARCGRPSIPPERLLRALLLQALYTVRSERQLMEQLDYNLLFRWFVGLGADDPVWHPSTFSKNRDRLLAGSIAQKLLDRVVRKAKERDLLSGEHFTVDGTLIQAWASLKSFRRKDEDDEGGSGGGRNATVNFHGERRSNETHRSTTDPEARLHRKSNGTAAELCFGAHVLMDNRHGLVVDGVVTPAGTRAEREAALAMLEQAGKKGYRKSRCSVGADKGYDTRWFIEALRALGVTPHVAAKRRYSAVDGRTTRHAGYDVSQRKRKVIEQIFGWGKTIGGLRQTRYRGRDRVGWKFTLDLLAYNLVRMRNLLAGSPA